MDITLLLLFRYAVILRSGVKMELCNTAFYLMYTTLGLNRGQGLQPAFVVATSFQESRNTHSCLANRIHLLLLTLMSTK